MRYVILGMTSLAGTAKSGVVVFSHLLMIKSGIPVFSDYLEKMVEEVFDDEI